MGGALSFDLDLKTEAGDELHYVETYYELQKPKAGKSTFLQFMTLDRYEFSWMEGMKLLKFQET